MKKYEIDTSENRQFMELLRNDLLSFGHGFASPEGGAYYLGDDGTPWTDRPRETWITCRMAHVYSMGELLGHKGSRQLADSAVKGLRGELHDDENGGWYAGICADGSVIPGKQCYAHAFVILAACSASLIKAAGADELLSEALDIYDRYFWNEEEGLAADTWNTDFTQLSDYRGINANMHTVEAFLAAADVLHDEKYRDRAGRIIGRVIKWAEDNSWRIPEHFTKEWKADLMLNRDKPDDPFKPFGATPGHGIEWARLISQYALSAHKDDKEKITEYTNAARNLYDRATADAWCADGAPGICYTTDWEGKPVVHDRMHWTLAEAINTSAVLYRITGISRYAADYAMFMKYLDESVVDHDNGSWFHQLDRNNHLKDTVWPGKSDLYHAVQATLIPYNENMGLSIAPALAL
ncbi:MAG: AGE family epimerase/isomerase [Lachnospiraceae bacterium]|nr:AGE family epimerase/isomerase [Lachnospiraceae bacterium]